jgi:hypothetical protein
MKRKRSPEDESRTTSMGLFNYADAYRMSGEALMAAKIETAHAESPVRFLYYHAIELFLKAFLREHDHSIAELETFGHRISKLTARAAELGLTFSDRDREVLDLMGEPDVVMRSRYIQTGCFTWPRVEALSDACENIRQDVGAALKQSGVPLRL